MVRIGREKYTYYFDRNNKPVASAFVGDKVVFETLDCWGGKVKKDEDLLNPVGKEPSTGPLFVKGAEPGDILVIQILDIKCSSHGTLALIPGEGVLKQYVEMPYTKIVTVKDDKTIFNDDIEIENKPHIGTIGTTPPGRIPTELIGSHGGNMDCSEAGVGVKLYFPVFLEGALLQMGDVHAAMGEGEICIGVECSAEVTIEILEVIKNRFIPAPFIESEEHWYVVANAPSLKEAIKICAKRMADFISYKLGIPLEDTNLLISVAGNIRIGQAADAGFDVAVYMQFPKCVDKKGRLEQF